MNDLPKPDVDPSGFTVPEIVSPLVELEVNTHWLLEILTFIENGPTPPQLLFAEAGIKVMVPT